MNGFTLVSMNMITEGAARLEELKVSAARALDAAAAGASLRDVLTDLCRAAERATDVEMLASVLLLDRGRLLEGAAPSLPAAYSAAISGAAIGPTVGSCGTAAHYGEAVFVDDIKTDPVWADFRDLALEHGLRACWSTPIRDEGGQILGTFANYYRTPRHPRPQDYAAIGLLAEAAAKVITASRATGT